jgi:hypothetical protein
MHNAQEIMVRSDLLQEQYNKINGRKKKGKNLETERKVGDTQKWYKEACNQRKKKSEKKREINESKEEEKEENNQSKK